jgi:hypothetical protein
VGSIAASWETLESAPDIASAMTPTAAVSAPSFAGVKVVLVS